MRNLFMIFAWAWIAIATEFILGCVFFGFIYLGKSFMYAEATPLAFRLFSAAITWGVCVFCIAGMYAAVKHFYNCAKDDCGWR